MSPSYDSIGHCEGDTCGRALAYGGTCKGVLELRAPVNCSCHLSAPCSACTSLRHFCPECGWEEANDIAHNDHVFNVSPTSEVRRYIGLRPLKPGTLDWHTFGHTHFTMRLKGVYPEGMSMEQVREKVRGTFGGRFERFGDGAFEYVAYTD